ncbi:hypothetical protein [Pseudolabrys sp.]|uniref:hypothetical protein n=1 Tax=Pseudolabrys sp. TaxID=1960880 RepID=UPI003D128F38
MDRRECVYVVGAGFSAGLGYPLTYDLLQRLWPRLDANFKKRLVKVIQFHHPRFDERRFSSFPNVEELLSEMFVNEELFEASREYDGSFTINDLREIQRELLTQIAAWFHELSKKVNPKKPDAAWLVKFRNLVRAENAAIISFNWDLILDELLFASQLDASSYGFGGDLWSSPVLLKPHGSLNWFAGPSAKFIGSDRRTVLYKEAGETVHAFLKFRSPISAKRTYFPLIVPPHHLKRFEQPVFRNLWRKCTSTLSTAKRVVFVGYSMPTADIHAQFILRCGFDYQVRGAMQPNGKRTKATGISEVTIINPDRAAAVRIESVAGPHARCEWVSTPAAEWVAQSI